MRHHRVKSQAARRAVVGCATWLSCFLALPALGHTMSVTRGTAIVARDNLTLTLQINAEDLLHTRTLIQNADGTFAIDDVRRAAETNGHAMCQRIVVRNDRGEKIDGRLKSWTLDHAGDARLDVDSLRRLRVSYVLDFAIGSGNDHLSLQQNLQRACVGKPTGIVLAVRGDGVPPQTIRLTGGGNVEVVRLATEASLATEEVGDNTSLAGASDVPPCRPETFVQSEAQRTVRAIVRIHDAGVRVDVFLPVRQLETWIPLARTQRDFLEVDEQIGFQEELTRFITRHNPMSIDGHRVDARRADDLVGIEFLDVGKFGGDPERTPRRLSAWTSRVRFTMEYDSPSHPRSVDLQWTLFNASVLTANALIVVDGDCLERDLLTYDPHLRWTAD